MLKRSVLTFGQIIKLPPNVGKYFMTGHKEAEKNPHRFELLDNEESRFKNLESKEGLNTLKYKLLLVEKRPLFIKFVVSYDQNEILKGFL